ncbi:aldehyde-activating protein [Thaumasiovibrio subtropicus]|uniref:aldehyde-activating protein n=1 Tax=Thaumasiovibrio subtropicus TaxID=1891207 RepID=UPI000B355F3D|nr:aldehyde-activating protein [Thaumasiovibrio subtropicus]
MYEGQCHCGNVKLRVQQLTATGTQCTCSICARYAAIWGYFTEADVVVSIGEFGISCYCHGDKLINFNRCQQCGCVTHYTHTTPTPKTRLAVNYRMFPSEVLEQITVRTFDGAKTWQYLD